MPGRRCQDGWEATSLLFRFVAFGLVTGQLFSGWRHDDSAVHQDPSGLVTGSLYLACFAPLVTFFFCFFHVDVNGLYDQRDGRPTHYLV